MSACADEGSALTLIPIDWHCPRNSPFGVPRAPYKLAAAVEIKTTTLCLESIKMTFTARRGVVPMSYVFSQGKSETMPVAGRS